MLTKRLRAVETSLASQAGRREVGIFASDLDGEALNEAVARWQNGEDLPDGLLSPAFGLSPTSITDRKNALVFVLVDLR